MRNTTISICKALAIICMVIGHADSPHYLMNFIYLWHMPLFFITAGYFFSTKYLNDEITFIKKRVKSLYIPFVKWSVIVLLLNPLFFATGFLNEHFGNPGGGVTHPLNAKQMLQSFVDIIFTMGGYDVFLLSAFWFFRALLVASIGYLVLFKLFKKVPYIRLNETCVVCAICITAYVFVLFKFGFGIKYRCINQGGYRDLMGIFFMGIGFLFRKYEGYIKRYPIAIGIVCLAATLVFTFWFGTSMSLNSKLKHVYRLPFAAIAGFTFVYILSSYIDKTSGWAKRFLVYCGDHSLQIMIWHIFAYKIVALLQIFVWNLEWEQIGCHMVIHNAETSNYLWILYSIAGVCIPLAWKYYYDKICTKHFLRSSSQS